MPANEVATTFLAFSVKRMGLSEADILRCLEQLSDDQIWHREGPHENSIANLLLHLEGNLRQWLLHGIAGQANVRVRDAEFAMERSDTALDLLEIRTRFSATIAECCDVIGLLHPDRLLETIDPQPGAGWGNPTVLEAIYQVVGHLQLHTGQIILLTKQLTGRDLDLTLPRKR